MLVEMVAEEAQEGEKVSLAFFYYYFIFLYFY